MSQVLQTAGYSLDDRVLRLEITREEDVKTLVRIEHNVAVVLARVNGRPSWAVTAYLAGTTTLCGILATLVATAH